MKLSIALALCFMKFFLKIISNLKIVMKCLKEEFYKVIGESSLNDKYDCLMILVGGNSMNSHTLDANNMQSQKLGDD